MKIYDVTVPMSEGMVVYPGDPRFQMTRREDGGAGYRVSTYAFGSHTGTHVDPPFHLLQDGLTADRIPLETLIGRVRVVAIAGPLVDEATLSDVDFSDAPRVLFKTDNSRLWERSEFVEEFVHITPGAATGLVSRGVKVVGIDYLSVDPVHDAELATHRVLLEAGVVIIEGLDLREVEPGHYEMICLPLKVAGSDGSPARVVLRK